MQLELSVVRNHREQQFYLSRSHFPKMFFFEIVSTRLLIQRPLKQSMQGMRWTDIESFEQLFHISLHGFKYQIVQQRHFQSWTLNSKRIRLALEFKVPRAKERSRSIKKTTAYSCEIHGDQSDKMWLWHTVDDIDIGTECNTNVLKSQQASMP